MRAGPAEGRQRTPNSSGFRRVVERGILAAAFVALAAVAIAFALRAGHEEHRASSTAELDQVHARFREALGVVADATPAEVMSTHETIADGQCGDVSLETSPSMTVTVEAAKGQGTATAAVILDRLAGSGFTDQARYLADGRFAGAKGTVLKKVIDGDDMEFAVYWGTDARPDSVWLVVSDRSRTVCR